MPQAHTCSRRCCCSGMLSMHHLMYGSFVQDGESFSLPIDDVDLLTYSVAVGSIVDISLKGAWGSVCRPGALRGWTWLIPCSCPAMSSARGLTNFLPAWPIPAPPPPSHPPAGGTLSADAGKNAACYGEGVSSEAILSGSVAPPPQLQPLYSRLSELASE